MNAVISESGVIQGSFTKKEVDRLVAWTLKAKTERNLSFADAVRAGIKNVLCSPAFLYLGAEAVEASAPSTAAKAQPVDDWQFASRQSYLLWSSTPDDHLYALAAKGQLR